MNEWIMLIGNIVFGLILVGCFIYIIVKRWNEL